MLEIWPPNYRKEKVGIPKLFSEAVNRGDVYQWGKLVKVSDNLQVFMCDHRTFIFSGREDNHRVILMQDRRRKIDRDGFYQPCSDDVIWLTEGDVAINMTSLHPATGLFLGFASRGKVRDFDGLELFALAMRGAQYEFSDQGFSFREVHNPYPEEVLVTDHLPSENKQKIASSATEVDGDLVFVRGFSEDGTLIEELEFPKTVDLRWKFVLQDPFDFALKNPDLPYQKWFDQLGVKIRCSNLNFPNLPSKEEAT